MKKNNYIVIICYPDYNLKLYFGTFNSAISFIGSLISTNPIIAALFSPGNTGSSYSIITFDQKNKQGVFL